MGAFVGEEVLLGEAGVGAEVGAAEVGDLGGFPVVEAVAADHGFDDPGIDGEGFEAAGAEEEDAIGDFFADAGEGEEAGFGFGVGGVFGGGEPGGVGGEEAGDGGDVAGTETEGTGTKLVFGYGGEFGPGGEAVPEGGRHVVNY